MFRRAAARAVRRWLLAAARRSSPQRATERSLERAIDVAREAATASVAYRRLLQEHGIGAAELAGKLRLADLPVLTKANTFGRFSLDELARPIATELLADVLTSSGRSGSHFGYRLTARKEYEAASFGIDLGLQDAFDVDQLPTLLVNCLPMGVVFCSRAVTVANVSVREDMACAILRDVGPRFKQTLLCTDPLFVRRLIDQGRSAGVDWPALNTSVIVGEEMLVEAQRDYIAARLGIDLDGGGHRTVASSFGVGELGLNLLFESRDTIRIKRAARRVPEIAAILRGDDAGTLPSVFCFAPQRLCLEVLAPDAAGWGQLCITVLGKGSVIPLPRFATGDVARLLDSAELAQACQLSGTAAPWLPVVLVRGRAADHTASSVSVEAVKELLYADHALADLLTGAFYLHQPPGADAVVLVQAKFAALADQGVLQSGLTRLAAALSPALVIKVLAPEDFPHRPVIDFERKFAYLASDPGPT